MEHFVRVECNKKTIYLVSRLLLDGEKTSLAITRDGSPDRILDLFIEKVSVRDEYHVIKCMAPFSFIVSRREMEGCKVPSDLLYGGEVVERALTFIGNKHSFELQDNVEVHQIFDELDYKPDEKRLLPMDPTPESMESILAILQGSEEDPLPYPAEKLPKLGEGAIHTVAALYKKLTGSYHFPLLSLTYKGPMQTIVSVLGKIPVTLEDLSNCNIGALSMNQCEALVSYDKYTAQRGLHSDLPVSSAIVEYVLFILQTRPWKEASEYLAWAFSPEGWNKRERKYANVSISTDGLVLALSGPKQYNQATPKVKKQIQSITAWVDKCRPSQVGEDDPVWPGAALRRKYVS